jgi:isopentenyldiphosphate isomerase
MPRENGIDEIEVHVATLCLDERDGALRVLIGKRADNRKIYPDLWECGGGQVRRGQTFQEAVRTQMKDEFGLDIEILFPSGNYKIETEGKIIPGIRFVCRPKPGQTVKIDNVEIVDFKWVTPEEFGSFDLIPGLADDILQAAAMRAKLAG